MPKARLLCTDAELNLRDNSLGRSRKEQLYARPVGTQWVLAPLKLCVPNLGGYDGQLYRNSSRGRGDLGRHLT